MKKIRNKTIIFSLLYFVFVILSLQNLFVATEFSVSDETTPIAISYRLFKGDIPFVETWDLLQLHGFVILPFLYLFDFLVGGKKTIGILLFFRILYFIIKNFIFIWGIIKFKKNNCDWNFYVGLTLWYIFQPFNIDNMTYQAVPLACLVVCLIVLKTKSSYLEFLIIGVLYSVSVLCQPFWVFSYPLLFIGYIVYRRRKCLIDTNDESILNFIFFQLGIIIEFCLFCFFVLSKTTLSSVIYNIKYFFSQGTHDIVKPGLISLFRNNIYNVFKWFCFTYKSISIINIFAIFVVFWLKIRKKDCSILEACPFLLLAFDYVIILSSSSSYRMNIVYFSYIYFAIEIILLGWIKKKSIPVILLGFTYCIFVAIGTDTTIFSPGAALCILSVVLLFDCNKTINYKNGKTIIGFSVAIVIFLSVIMRIYEWPARFDQKENPIKTFINEKPWEICRIYDLKKIEEGPLKGLYSKENIVEDYMKQIDGLNNILDKEKGKTISLINIHSSIFLSTECKIGMPYIVSLLFDTDMFQEYYLNNPERYPDIVIYRKINDENEKMIFDLYKNAEIYSIE